MLVCPTKKIARCDRPNAPPSQSIKSVILAIILLYSISISLVYVTGVLLLCPAVDLHASVVRGDSVLHVCLVTMGAAASIHPDAWGSPSLSSQWTGCVTSRTSQAAYYSRPNTHIPCSNVSINKYAVLRHVAGRQLLDKLQEYLEEHDTSCQALYLHCLSTNSPALRFYQVQST